MVPSKNPKQSKELFYEILPKVKPLIMNTTLFTIATFFHPCKWSTSDVHSYFSLSKMATYPQQQWPSTLIQTTKIISPEQPVNQ